MSNGLDTSARDRHARFLESARRQHETRALGYPTPAFQTGNADTEPGAPDSRPPPETTARPARAVDSDCALDKTTAISGQQHTLIGADRLDHRGQVTAGLGRSSDQKQPPASLALNLHHGLKLPKARLVLQTRRSPPQLLCFKRSELDAVDLEQVRQCHQHRGRTFPPPAGRSTQLPRSPSAHGAARHRFDLSQHRYRLSLELPHSGPEAGQASRLAWATRQRSPAVRSF
jgi:hypothetical protein